MSKVGDGEFVTMQSLKEMLAMQNRAYRSSLVEDIKSEVKELKKEISELKSLLVLLAVNMKK